MRVAAVLVVPGVRVLDSVVIVMIAIFLCSLLIHFPEVRVLGFITFYSATTARMPGQVVAQVGTESIPVRDYCQQKAGPSLRSG
jgi:membrane glycosyltransferase